VIYFAYGHRHSLVAETPGAVLETPSAEDA
jgi:hypothetical protein